MEQGFWVLLWFVGFFLLLVYSDLFYKKAIPKRIVGFNYRKKRKRLYEK